MVNYYVKRTGKAILTAYVVVTITFGLSRMLPGGPIKNMRNRLINAGITPAQADVMVQSNLRYFDPDASVPEQFVQWMIGLHQGDLGVSIIVQEGDPVVGILATRLPWTIFISVVAILIFYLIALTLGSVAAYYEGSRFDTANSALAITMSGIPFFVMAILLAWIFGAVLGFFPTTGRYNIDMTAGLRLEYIQSVLYHGALPIASIVLARYGVRALAMRGNSVSELGKGYVTVAQLRGLPDWRIATRYVGRNAVLPMYTGMLLAFGWIIGGTVVLEDVFQYKGIGLLLLQALNENDYPVLMGAFLIITLALVFGIYLADLTYGLVDPRISTGDDSEAY